MTATWKTRLADAIAPDFAEEIDVFEKQLELRKHGRIEEKLFAETRLRRGVYGQRYDNGQRHDGVQTQAITYPDATPTKGPETLWHAPGMQRIKLPWGGVSPRQLEVMAELAEEYSDGILHITTRQDVQLHFVHIEDTPDLMRRLAAVGITTREACGNSVRNVTACPVAGVCRDEAFDVTAYADAMFLFLLGHPDTQDFGRKFKIAFSGCTQHACGLTTIHDLGAIATTRTVDGRVERGFALYVGGGLGAVPHQAPLFDEFVSERELLPLTQAICRVFGRHGEKANRARARIKFVIKKLGIEEFRRLVLEERALLPDDPRWTSYLERLLPPEQPLRPASTLIRRGSDEAFDRWRSTNVQAQRQSGYSVVTVALPLGDMTADQARGLADVAREFTGDHLRTTVEQNIVLRWVSDADVPKVHERLQQLGLAQAGAGTIVDVTACPGTDTCKLGISSSRGLAGELRERLAMQAVARDEAVQNLRIKVSGCHNSCGQHHIADLGFLGVSRNVDGRRVPHFQVVVGGQWTQNAASYGLPLGAVPSRRIPDVVDRLTGKFASERERGESFQDYIRRVGKKAVRAAIEDLIPIPSYESDRSYFHDWGDPREYSIGDMGQGECAGEVVSATKFGLADSEREVLEAQDLLERGEAHQATERAYKAMLVAAKALVRAQTFDIADDAEQIVTQFRVRFCDTQLFWDKYAGGKFAEYLLRLHERDRHAASLVDARHFVEEAQHFIDHAYRIEEKLALQGPAPVGA